MLRLPFTCLHRYPRFYFINSTYKNSTFNKEIKWKVLPSAGNELTPKLILKSFGELSKFKLSALVLLTTMSGHLMAAASATQLTVVPNLGYTLLGTVLCSFSANSFNQWAEAPLDAQMPRTQGRPVPKLILTPFTAFNWACLVGGSGLGILTVFVNPMTAGLAGLTILLYAGVYTPLKRISIINTWIGALVGAIPPLIGWTSIIPKISCASLILPAVLFCWQFPHFNALSWNLRSEYARAGYKMTSLLNPSLNTRVALRYSILLIPITLAAPLLNLTTPLFAITGNLINAPLIFQATKFWWNPTRKSARGLFFTSLLHLPIYMTFLFVHREEFKEAEEEEGVIKE